MRLAAVGFSTLNVARYYMSRGAYMSLRQARSSEPLAPWHGWEQDSASRGWRVSPLMTVQRLEAQQGRLRATTTTVDSLQRALEAAGVEFTNGDRPGVRMREPTAA